VKTLVTSRMGNKKAASKRNKKEEEAKYATTDWSYSKCSRNNQLNLVAEGLLQGEDVVQWYPSFRQPIPQENVDAIILFLHVLERG
jgi:hypothetical protein